MDYDRTNRASIVAHAQKLIDETLRKYVPANVAKELSE